MTEMLVDSVKEINLTQVNGLLVADSWKKGESIRFLMGKIDCQLIFNENQSNDGTIRLTLHVGNPSRPQTLTFREEYTMPLQNGFITIEPSSTDSINVKLEGATLP